MANFTNSTQWTNSTTLTKQSGTILTIATKNKFVDRDIKITLGVRSGVASVSATGNATINSIGFTYNSNDGSFNVSGSKALTGTASVTVITPGWINSINNGTTTGTATIDANVDMIHIGADMSGTAKVTPVINNNSNSNVLTGTKTTSKPSNGYYLAVQSAAASNTITATPSVTTAGYGTTEHFVGTNDTLSVGANASAITYFPITSGSISLSAPGSASITNLTYSYNSTSGKFNVTGSGNITGTATATVTEGYIANNATGNISGTASLSGVTINKVGVKATLSGATSALKPTISRITTNDATSLNVGSGDAATAAPETGYYVAVKSNANTASITATPAVSSAGYGTPTNGQYTVTATDSKTVGAAASDTYYITVPSGSATTPATTITTNPTISIDSAGLITASYSGSQSVTPTVSSGYIEAGTAGTISTTGSATKQLTTKGATTYNVSTSNQTIAAGTYLTGAQTFRAVTTLNIDAANIKSGVNVRVGDAGSATRIKNVTGTFTKANTVSSGQTAAAAGQILSGYSAWVDAAEVKGSIPIKTSSDITVSASDNSITIPAGYYRTDAELSMTVATVTPSFSDANLDTYFNAGTSDDNDVIIKPNYTNTAGYIAEHTTAQDGDFSYYKIKTTTRTKGAGSVTLTAGNGNATFAVGAGDSENSSAKSLQFATSAPSSGVYYTLTITGKGTVTGTGKGTVSTGTGWITSGSTTSNDSASSSQDSKTATIYRYINKSVHGTAVTNSLPSSISGRTSGTYLDIEIQPKGYVKIPAGYNPLDRYVFANVADAAGESRAASGFSLAVSSVSGSSAVTVGELSGENYPITANNLSITATLSASTAGWFSTGSATDSDTDSVTVGIMPAAIIGGSSSNATATTTVAPGTITINNAATDVSGKTKVTIAPVTATTGISTYYIPLKASAAANTTGTTSAISGDGTATVIKAGYAPASLTGTISVSGAATAKTSKKDSSDYYIPLPTASGAWQTGTTVAAKATPGITNTDSINIITSPTGTAGTDYWTLTPTIASSTAGTYKAKYVYNSNGQGWVPNSVTLTDGTARSVSVSAQAGTAIYIPKAVYSTTAGKTTVTTAGYLPEGTVVTNITTVTPKFDGGELTGKTASATGTNATLETTNNSGISILAKGTAGRTAVLYNGAVNGYVNIADNTTASDAISASTWNGTTYYIKDVTLPKDKTFKVTTAADTELDTTSDLDIINAAYRRVDISNAANGTVLIANSGNTTVTSGSKTAGDLTVAAYDTTSATATTNKLIVDNGVWTTTSPTAAGTYYGRITLGAGSHSAGTTLVGNSTVTPKVNLDASATSSYGFTTTQPSGTTGTNYITVDPDATATAWTVTPTSTATAGYVGAGTVNGTAASQTPSIAAGTNYYVPIVTPAYSGGNWTVNTDTNSITTTPVVTVTSSGTFKTSTSYGVTDTKPGGTDGTNYLTIDGSGSVTTTGVATSSWKTTKETITYSAAYKGLVNLTSGGQAVASSNKTGGKTANITPSITDNFSPLYIPIVTGVTVNGGGLTPTNYSKSDLALTLTSGSNTNMSNITLGNQDTSTYPYYFKVNGSTPAVSGTTKVTRAAITYTNSAGAIAAHTGASAIGADSSSPSVSVNATSASTYVSLKKATMTVAGSNTVTPSVSVGSDTNIVYATSDVSGVSFKATGGGTAKATATATTNIAGYAPANTQLGSNTSITASSSTINTTKYIQGVKLVAPTVSGEIRYFDIIVPNGNTTDFITFRFTVKSNGEVTVTGPD